VKKRRDKGWRRGGGEKMTGIGGRMREYRGEFKPDLDFRFGG